VAVTVGAGAWWACLPCTTADAGSGLCTTSRRRCGLAVAT